MIDVVWRQQGGKYTDTAERRPGFTFCFLMPFAAHTRMQGKAVGPGHPLHSGIRPVQWTDGAYHESFASLLWADGYAVSDGTAMTAINDLLDGFYFEFVRVSLAAHNHLSHSHFV